MASTRRPPRGQPRPGPGPRWPTTRRARATPGDPRGGHGGLGRRRGDARRRAGHGTRLGCDGGHPTPRAGAGSARQSGGRRGGGRRRDAPSDPALAGRHASCRAGHHDGRHASSRAGHHDGHRADRHDGRHAGCRGGHRLRHAGRRGGGRHHGVPSDPAPAGRHDPGSPTGPRAPDAARRRGASHGGCHCARRGPASMGRRGGPNGPAQSARHGARRGRVASVGCRRHGRRRRRACRIGPAVRLPVPFSPRSSARRSTAPSWMTRLPSWAR